MFHVPCDYSVSQGKLSKMVFLMDTEKGNNLSLISQNVQLFALY